MANPDVATANVAVTRSGSGYVDIGITWWADADIPNNATSSTTLALSITSSAGSYVQDAVAWTADETHGNPSGSTLIGSTAAIGGGSSYKPAIDTSTSMTWTSAAVSFRHAGVNIPSLPKCQYISFCSW